MYGSETQIYLFWAAVVLASLTAVVIAIDIYDYWHERNYDGNEAEETQY